MASIKAALRQAFKLDTLTASVYPHGDRAAKNWLKRLSREQRAELGSLAYGWRVADRDWGPAVPGEMVQDWIEEHGGEREWVRDVAFRWTTAGSE